MAYGAKYITEFRDIEENLFKITFYWRDYEGEVTEVTPAANPFKRTYHRADKFAAVKGMSAEIVLFAEQDRQFLDLYTADYKQCMVEVLKNGIPFFLGYLDAETYQETFSEDKYYDVSIFANNGINVLERDRYVDENGDTYSGSADMLTVIERIIQSLGLPLQNIKYAADIAVNSYSVPADEIILQHLIVNQDNYIDEDGIVMSNRNVLESLLTPLGLTLFIEGEDVWIVDTEYLKNETITVLSKPIGSGTFSAAQINIVKDLADLAQASGEFMIEAGFNLYKLTKNRYVKDVIEEVDFDDEDNYEGGEYDNVWSLETETIRSDNYDFDGTRIRKWIHKLTSFEGWDVNSNTLPNIGGTNYFSTHNEVSFCGGFKAISIVDDVTVNYDEDGNDFDNYIIINSPYKDYFDSTKVSDLAYTAVNHFDYDISSIERLAATYTNEVPFIFNSDKAVIRLNFTAQFLSTGIAGAFGNYGEFRYLPIEDYPDEYGVFLLYTKILFKDAEGNIRYFLRLKGSENYDSDSEIPFPAESEYELVEYTGQDFDYCLIYISNINEVGNQENILNIDTNVSIDIPANFDGIYKLDFQIYNMWFRCTDKEYGDYGSQTKLDHLKPVADFKETLPHLAIKDIYTQIIDKDTGEAINLNDEELQYYLSEQFKTEKQDDELYHYTADDQYITDLGGITLDNDYINQVSANGVTKDNFEDLRGDKIIRQYQDNQIVLTLSLYEDDLPAYTLLMMQNDPLWNRKKFVVVSATYDAKMRTIDVVLEEVK